MRAAKLWRIAACLLALAPMPQGRAETVAAQPAPSPQMAAYMHTPKLSPDAASELKWLRQRVKYVFVIFQENRSFDSYFGSFPGADGLFSQPPAQTPGYRQPIVNVDGSTTFITPFRVGPALHSADLDDVDHGQLRMATKMDVHNGVAAMDRFALAEEQKYSPSGPSMLKAKQYGELTMAYVDCDTIPLLWRLAARFVLFDHIFQRTIGPSTPNAIALIAGQTGETQWVKHPATGTNIAANAAQRIGEPLISDADPAFGPRNPIHKGGLALNQTYASLPLSFSGRAIRAITATDTDATDDLADVEQDIPAIARHAAAPVDWGWYEEGYDREPTNAAVRGPADHASYISHHNGPQYFGYVDNNPVLAAHLHGLGDFFADIAAQRLPAAGGVFYVRGGFADISGQKPAFADPAVQKMFGGDDDHPGYSDSHLSEAMVARSVNAIANSRYWGQSVIIVTYDESEGDYDHVPPRQTETDPAGMPLANGPRIPLILISPFARAHAISHEEGNHASVIRLIEEIFGLPTLATLPDELQARITGQRMYHQAYLGAADALTPGVGNLLSGFDPARLAKKAAPLPPDYAEIPNAEVLAIPPYGDHGCQALGITPTDVAQGVRNPVPADFNPRPSTDPTITPGK